MSLLFGGRMLRAIWCRSSPLVNPAWTVAIPCRWSSGDRSQPGQVEETRQVLGDIEHLIKKPEPPPELRGMEKERWEPDVMEDVFGNRASPQARSRNIIVTLQEPMAIEPQLLRFKFRKAKSQILRLDQTYDNNLLDKLGPDLLAAYFFVQKEAKVKLVQENDWFSLEQNINILKAYQSADQPKVEAIDASNCSLVYEGMDFLRGLKSLKYLNLANCPRIDDHCLAKIAVHCQTLEFLDISGCPQVSERGLATLHTLTNLKKLVVTNMDGVLQKQLICLLLEEAIPGLFIVGVEYNKETIDAEIEADKKKYEKRYQLSETREVDDSYLNRDKKIRFLQKVFFKYLPKSNEHSVLAQYFGTPGKNERYSQVKDTF